MMKSIEWWMNVRAEELRSVNKFYDRYRERTIGDCKSVKEHNLRELEDDFEEVLNDALTCDE